MFSRTAIPIWKISKVYSLAAIFAWSCLIGCLCALNVASEKKSSIEKAKIEARNAFDKDILYRRWNAFHGGVYVPIKGETIPNPYLNIPEKSIQTPSGVKLTKLNPAYMTRQVYEMSAKANGVKGHITSLNPIRPQNRPDDWEASALLQFENGAKVVSEVVKLKGETHLRFMRPLVTEKGCLACHESQGYQIGDIRGGISVSVPMSSILEVEKTHVFRQIAIFGVIWLIGLSGIVIGSALFKRQVYHRMHSQEQYAKMSGVVEMAGAVSHELNQPMQALLIALQLLKMDKQQSNRYKSELDIMEDQIDRMKTITEKLMNITQYKTKKYLKREIIDIDKSSERKKRNHAELKK